jgi:hypothetical protein
MACYHIYGEHNVSFVHIPKNAGTSIFTWLRTNRGNSKFFGWHGHPTLAEMRRDRSDIQCVLTSVRNPWARMVSYYTMIQSYYNQNDFMKNVLGVEFFDSFENFVIALPTWSKHLDTSTSKKLDSLYYTVMDPQSAWLSGETADIVLRQEYINEDFVQVQEMFGCSEPLPWLNTSKHDDYRSYYNDTTKKIVAGWHEQDIDTWKYTF